MSKKGCLITLAVGACVVVGIIALVFYLTAGAVKEADRVLALLGNGKVREAYLSMSSTLRQDEEMFTGAVKRLGLTDYASSSWTTRSVENNVANLEGTATTKKGGSIPLKVKLVKEEDGWKVFSIEAPEAGVGADGPKHMVPSDQELQRLAKETLLDFSQAVQAKDFAPFYQKISILWQGQTTPNDLRKSFQEFQDRNVDFSSTKDVIAVFDKPPALDHKGWLVVSGYYPTRPLRVLFTLGYTYEHPTWRLAGIEVKTQK